ncbi:MAG: GNAT family N-acetyltransferase [Acetatifactor sp.]|nr:GNAT family N-acetyltransferase [Acetatifactor sp.]
MIFEPVTITDKLGREIVLRNAEVRDAKALREYLRVTTGETPFLIREPDEVTITVEQEEHFLQTKIDNPNELMLIATIDGRHIGNCSMMSIGNYRRYSHRCDIAIALYQEFCGLGIGRAMLETVLDVAKKTGYEQAELEVIADNQGAIALYEKLGFVKYGTFPDNMKYNDGTYADAYWMMKKL